MGDNNLTARTDGEKIPATDHNELVQAFVGDVVPRNNSRVPEDIIGQLGTSVFRWLRAYLKELYLGDAANNLRIYEGSANTIYIEAGGPNDSIRITSGGNIDFYRAGSLVFRTTASGIDWATQPALGIPHANLVNNIPYSKIATKEHKESIGFSNMGGTAETLSINITSGKKYLVVLNIGRFIHSGAGTSDVLLFKVNGTINKEFSLNVTGIATHLKKTFSLIYTATTTTTYSFSFDPVDTDIDWNGDFYVTEI